MQVVTAAEMRDMDRQAVERYAIPEIVLMEHAGKALADRAWQLVNGSSRRRVVIFVGKGNNGGDGCVAARHLHNRGATVRLVPIDEPNKFTGECARQLDMAARVGVEIIPLSKRTERKIQFHAAAADLIIDAVLGTGSRGAPRGAARTAIELINGAGAKVLAADLPSGVDADTGAVAGAAVLADATVTFALPKIGLLFGPGRELAGTWTAVDIGMPRQLLTGGTRHVVTADLVRDFLPVRPPAGHKGTFGRVLVVAGSQGMAGAAMLAAQGAQRVGAGLVQLAGPEMLHDVFAVGVPEAISLPLAQVNGTVAASGAEEVLAAAQEAAAIVIGPGLGRSDDVRSLVKRVVADASARVPVVVDADGLNALAEAGVLGRPSGGRLAGQGAGLVLTPHPGEMARLCGVTAADVVARPLEFAERYAQQWGAIVVLKSSPTVVADPQGHSYINSTGSAALASGGTGDVLAGAIGGFIAQGAPPVAAAVAAVFIHGAAGDGEVVELGASPVHRPHMAGLTATDVALRLPQVLAQLRAESYTNHFRQEASLYADSFPEADRGAVLPYVPHRRVCGGQRRNTAYVQRQH